MAGKTAFDPVAIIGGGGKIIGFAFFEARNRGTRKVTDIDTVLVIIAGSTIVDAIAGKIGFVVWIPGQLYLCTICYDR